MLRTLSGLTLLTTLADHWTTYLCLREPVSGWQVVEANPIAGWLFDSAGLVPGLAIDSVLTLVGLAFLTTSPQLAARTKTSLLAGISVLTAAAVVNNLAAISTLGIASQGWAG
jgi:hypothetical protein